MQGKKVVQGSRYYIQLKQGHIQNKEFRSEGSKGDTNPAGPGLALGRQKHNSRSKWRPKRLFLRDLVIQTLSWIYVGQTSFYFYSNELNFL